MNKVHAVVEILKAAEWHDTCDAQWAGIEAILPELRAVLTAELVRDAELIQRLIDGLPEATDGAAVIKYLEAERDKLIDLEKRSI